MLLYNLINNVKIVFFRKNLVANSKRDLIIIKCNIINSTQYDIIRLNQKGNAQYKQKKYHLAQKIGVELQRVEKYLIDRFL